MRDIWQDKDIVAVYNKIILRQVEGVEGLSVSYDTQGRVMVERAKRKTMKRQAVNENVSR